MGCGLKWSVPPEWRNLPRCQQIELIKEAITKEMSASYIDTTDIKYFLDMLSKHTAPLWRHQFHTTNWDFLLQREILKQGYQRLPKWLAQSHVYHLNGTAENLADNSHRSSFVLESDTTEARVWTVESEKAFDKFKWSKTFVVVGMSVECECDRYLLIALNKIEDYLPVGESRWIVVNPDADTLDKTCQRLQKALPSATIKRVKSTFHDWLNKNLPELQLLGPISIAATQSLQAPKDL